MLAERHTHPPRSIQHIPLAKFNSVPVQELAELLLKRLPAVMLLLISHVLLGTGLVWRHDGLLMCHVRVVVNMAFGQDVYAQHQNLGRRPRLR